MRTRDWTRYRLKVEEDDIIAMIELEFPLHSNYGESMSRFATLVLK